MTGSLNRYPVGNQVVLRFYFGSRPLTTAEKAQYLAGNGLPAGVGQDQTTVKCDVTNPTGVTTTLSGGSIIHDATGAYHAIFTLALKGTHEYQGYSLDGSNNPVARTEVNVIEAE